MNKTERKSNRTEILTRVAEMYYEEGLTQSKIAKEIGMTRSAISRMLTEARQKGIVEIHIHRPLKFHSDLEIQLKERFNLRGAHVISRQENEPYPDLQNRLGKAASNVLSETITPGDVIGIAWGTTVQATIGAIEMEKIADVRVVQLLGVLGSTHHAYSGQILVEQMAEKLGGEGVYLYTPFIVDNETTAQFLKNDQSVSDAMSLGRQCNVALLGVGSTRPDFCSLFIGNHISRADLDSLLEVNAVGDVSGYYFDRAGKLVDVNFHQRLMGIAHEDLHRIPVRLGVAGGEEKAEAIYGALSGNYINILVTDSITAAKILAQDDNAGQA